MSQLCYHGLQFPIFTEIVTFSYLDAGYQFAEAPIRIVHFVCARPVAAFLVQLVPVAHVDEWCREVQGVVRHTFQHQLVGFAVVLAAVVHAVLRPVVQPLHQWPQGQFFVAYRYSICKMRHATFATFAVSKR